MKMTMRGGPTAGDRGETLLELLVAVLIMGIAVVGLIGGIGTGLRMSDIHRKQATAGAYVRSFAEAVETAVAGSPSAYVDCAGTSSYASAFTLTDPRYTARVLAVAYWTSSGFSATCTPGSDSGVQLISLSVDSSDDLAAETLDLIIRRPCRSVTDFPLDAPCT